MSYSEWLRPDHRPGLEGAGYDELDTDGEPPWPVGVVPLAPFEPDIRCKHGYRDCHRCDGLDEWRHG